MAYLNYTTKTIDTTDDLINLGLNEFGLIIDGQKTTIGAPDTTAGKYIPGAMIINEVTPGTYQNTGTTAVPVWTLMGSGGGGSPSAPVNSVQFNNAGAFGGDANFTFTGLDLIMQSAGAIKSKTFSVYNPGFGQATSLVYNGISNFTLNLPVSSGANGDQLTTDGAGNLSWTASGGLAIPLTQIVFGTGAGVTSTANFTWDNATQTLTAAPGGVEKLHIENNFQQLGGSAVANININSGTGVHLFSGTDFVFQQGGNRVVEFVPSTLIASIGDVNSAGNDTLLTVDDTAQLITGNVVLNSVTGELTAVDVSIVGAQLMYRDGIGGQWGFEGKAGGSTLIYENTDVYTWPGADGNAGDVMTTDGAGTLSFENVGVITRKVSLSVPQISVLNANPITLVAAPGAGKYIEVLSVTGNLNFNTTAYATNTTLNVRDATTTNSLFTDGAFAGTLLPAVANTLAHLEKVTLGSAIAITPNGAVDIMVPGGNPTAGDGTLDIYVTYKIITL